MCAAIRSPSPRARAGRVRRGRVSLRGCQSGRRVGHDAAQPPRPQAASTALRRLAGPMFYEDFRIGQLADLGETTFSREAILAYGRRFDPRIVAQAAAGGGP